MKASTLLRLSDGTVATLAEHLDAGRMVVDPEPCRGSRGGVAYTASEVGTTKVVTIGKTLWQSRTRAADGPVAGVKWDGHGAVSQMTLELACDADKRVRDSQSAYAARYVTAQVTR